MNGSLKGESLEDAIADDDADDDDDDDDDVENGDDDSETLTISPT